MVDVNLPVLGMAVLTALAYVLYGVLRAKARGDMLSLSRVLPVIVAAVFLAIIEPGLIPTNPDDVFLLPMIALTAFATFGALYVFQRLYEVAVAIYWYLLGLLNRTQDKLTVNEDEKEDMSVQPKTRRRTSKPKPKQNSSVVDPPQGP